MDNHLHKLSHQEIEELMKLAKSIEYNEYRRFVGSKVIYKQIYAAFSYLLDCRNFLDVYYFLTGEAPLNNINMNKQIENILHKLINNFRFLSNE